MNYVSKPNFDGYIVIGAGLPRTGTASMRCALSLLLDGPIYHMYELAVDGQDDTQFWIEASQKEKSAQEWKDFLAGRGFRGGVDYPPSLFYK